MSPFRELVNTSQICVIVWKRGVIQNLIFSGTSKTVEN